MKRVGLICDMSFSRHPQFKSYFYALETLVGTPKLVKDKFDLFDIDVLVVGDDHYEGHKRILHAPGFISCLNALDIKTIILTTEKIYGSYFPHNIENMGVIKTIKNLHHHNLDVDDCIKLGNTVHRVTLSKKFENIVQIPNKLNKAVFIGNSGFSYDVRHKTLLEVKKEIELDVFKANFETWESYMSVLAKYRFVFSPIGNGNFFPTRFYEALMVGSIPIHQVMPNTLDYYKVEKEFEDCIYFEKSGEVAEKVKNCDLKHSYHMYWTEDHLKDILTQDSVL